MAGVLVLGNVNADHVLRLERPLAPGQDIGVVDLGLRLGGAAANAASALALAGNAVRLVGTIGGDAAGDAVADALARLPLDSRDVVRVGAPTSACWILIAPDGERTILTRRNALPMPVWPETFELAGIDAIYVGSRTCPPDGLFEAACAAGVPVVAQFRRDAVPPGSVAVVIAAEEAFAGADPWRAAQAAGFGAGWLVVTRGAAGLVATDGRTHYQMPALPADVVDTTGAGDAFSAGLVHGLARRWPIETCLMQGLRWGALAVAHVGSTAPPTVATAVDRPRATAVDRSLRWR